MNRESDVRGGDGIGWWQLAGVALAAVVVASALAVAPGATAAQSGSNNTTFIVQQGSQCTQVTPLGNGSQNVSSFYDYRSTLTDPHGLYSSYGTRGIQKSQVSQVFVYRGNDGLSLVFLHDKLGDEHGGLVITGDISGLPTDGAWTVEDDDYNHQSDVFDTNASNGSSAHIQWFSNGNRTDGAAFTGLESPNYSTITVGLKFNKQSGNFPYKKWNSPPAQNLIKRWVVRSGTGKTTQLDMNRSIQISPGTCNGGVSTFTATQASGSNATTGTSGTSTAATTAPTAATTQTTTATRTATPSPTATTQASSSTATAAGGANGNETATQASSGGNGSGGNGNTGNGNGSGGSGAFGPGFGVGVALLAVLLAVTALVRRND